jgi:hypothetical protein
MQFTLIFLFYNLTCQSRYTVFLHGNSAYDFILFICIFKLMHPRGSVPSVLVPVDPRV